MNKHTPGPWEFLAYTGQWEVKALVQGEYVSVLTVAGIFGCPGVSAKEAEANAILMAAAPEMLAALRAANAIHAHFRDCRECTFAPLRNEFSPCAEYRKITAHADDLRCAALDKVSGIN